MSKRFGRNQRRKLREANATLAAAAHAYREKAERETRRGGNLEEELREWNAEIISLLGEYSAFQRSTPNERVRDIRDVRSMDASRIVLLSPMSMNDMPYLEMQRILMRRLVAEIDERREDLRLYMRLSIEDESDSVLLVSPQVFRDRNLGPRELEYLVERYAKQIMEHFNGGMAERRRKRREKEAERFGSPSAERA